MGLGFFGSNNFVVFPVKVQRKPFGPVLAGAFVIPDMAEDWRF